MERRGCSARKNARTSRSRSSRSSTSSCLDGDPERRGRGVSARVRCRARHLRPTELEPASGLRLAPGRDDTVRVVLGGDPEGHSGTFAPFFARTVLLVAPAIVGRVVSNSYPETFSVPVQVSVPYDSTPSVRVRVPLPVAPRYVPAPPVTVKV